MNTTLDAVPVAKLLVHIPIQPGLSAIKCALKVAFAMMVMFVTVKYVHALQDATQVSYKNNVD